MREPDRTELESLVASFEAGSTAARPQRQRAVSAVATRQGQVQEAFDSVAGWDELRRRSEAIRSEHASDITRSIAESKRVAAERAAADGQRLESLANAARVVLDDRAPEPDGVAPWVPDRQPVLFIRSTPGATLRDSHIEQDANWAKWEASASGDAIATTGSEKLSFFHLWQNPRRRTLLVDITVGLTLRGHASANADGMGFPAGLLWADSQVDVDVSAQLSVWPLWLAHAPQPVHAVPVASSSARGGVFGDAETASISDNVYVQAVRYAVPRGAYILIEASVVADFRCYSGTAEADFASADSFRVDCPYCVVISVG